MRIEDFVVELKRDGIYLELIDEKIKINAPKGALRDEIVIKIRERKSEIIEFLNSRSLQKEYQKIKTVEKKEFYSLSSAQKRLYFIQQLDVNSISYNMPMALPMDINIDIDKVEQAFRYLVDRHDCFRTSFIIINDQPVQQILEKINFNIEHINTTETELEQLIKDCIKPFDLSKDILIRVYLINVSQKYYVLIVDMHHIISDGTTVTIIREDFLSLFKGETLPPLKLQYKDFSNWQNKLLENDEIKNQEKYWMDLLSGELPKLNLFTDNNRPENFTFKGESYVFELDEEDVHGLRNLGMKHGGTLYMNLLTILTILFYKYTGQTDIVIGCSAAGRRHADLHRIAGMFVNALAMRNFPEWNKKYTDFFREVILKSFTAFDNQDIQFEYLVDKLNVKRDSSRNPIFDICMVVQNFNQQDDETLIEQGEDTIYEKQLYKNITSKFDMTFFVYERGKKVIINIEYYSDIFKKETIKKLSEHLRNIIKVVIDNPNIILDDISLLNNIEKQKILDDLCRTEVNYPKDKTLYELFEKQVDSRPDAIALVFCDENISYKELDKRSNQLSNYLIHEYSIKPDDIVGILMDKSIYCIISILGILKSGGAYLPISSGQPEDRTKQMIDVAGLKILISEKKHVRLLNRLLWESDTLKAYLCMDSNNIHFEEEEKSNLMDKKLWEFVGERGYDAISKGGWLSSYNGLPIPKVEMDEYSDNILKKLLPLLHKEMRVLEIGCATGLSMYRIAPYVSLFYGTDLSEVIIEENKDRVNRENITNIKLDCLAAHELDKLKEKYFDLIIMNSVVQHFHGHNYLRKVIQDSISMIKTNGMIFIGDVMDQDLKAALIQEMIDYEKTNKVKEHKTKTSWNEELFISKSYFEDLQVDFPEISELDFSKKIFTIENELTKFRYDVLLRIVKKENLTLKKNKQKRQEDSRCLNGYDSKRPVSVTKPENLCYVIYTSGTSGTPKGAMIEHRNVVSLLCNKPNYFNFKNTEVWTMFHSYNFDFSVWEMYGALLYGGKLILISSKESRNLQDYLKTLKKEHVTILNITPSAFYALQEIEKEHETRITSLNYIIFGGEALQPSRLAYWKKKYSSVKLINMFGITETTVHVTYKEIDELEIQSGISNIGRPLPTMGLFVMDSSQNISPKGIPGELYVSGEGVGRGYLNDKELTEKKFINNPYKIGEKVYRSGDLVRIVNENELEYLGRIDSQVKIRGYRVELGEIENQLQKYEQIENVVVVARGNGDDKLLYAYYVSKRKIEVLELRKHMAKKLPDYMIPSWFIQIESIPLTKNNKIDKNNLPKPEIIQDDDFSPPSNELENKLVKIWSDILNIPKDEISVNVDFFDIGGHSLKATILVSKIHNEFNVKLPLKEVFKNSTVHKLALIINSILKYNMNRIEEETTKKERIVL